MKALKKKGIVAIEAIQSKLDSIVKGVNSKLSSFSRIRRAEIQVLPFERTPTDKIKRFLYQKKA
jgi:long-chain acyl-CoA synthetase